MTKLRSPNYPKHTLEEACRKVQKVYNAEHTHPAAREVVAKDLGYTSLNGASLTMIGTLNSYGLLEPEGEMLKVSDDAVTIIELPEGDPERNSALRRRAFAPKLFEELLATFGDNLPSDVNLRHFLIKRKFLPKAADEVIRIYRENLGLVTSAGDDYNAPEPDNLPQGAQMSSQPSQSSSAGQYPTDLAAYDRRRIETLPSMMSSQPEEGQLLFPLYLSKNQKATLSVPAEMSQKQFKLLKQQIANSLAVMQATALIEDEPDAPASEPVRPEPTVASGNDGEIADLFKDQ